jgi:hypothetical protein
MERAFVLGAIFFMGTFVAACGSDDDDSSGTGGTSSGGTSSGGSAGSATGGSSGAGTVGVTCPELCAQVAPLGCAKGPPSESLCVVFCDSTKNSTSDPTCKAAMTAVLDCENTKSDMSCASDGYVTSTACATEWTAVNPCLPEI